MANNLPYYPLYVNDFDEDPKVLAMNLAEVGLYQLALNESWKRGSIPADPKALAILIRRKSAEVCKAWPQVLPCWIENGVPGRLVNPRQEKEREIAATKSAVASDAGRNNAKKRWSSSEEVDANGIANGMHMRSESVSASSPTQLPTTEEPQSRERVTFEALMWKWKRQKGAKKPQKPILLRAEETWSKVNISSDQADAALSGFFASDWARSEDFPLPAFVKDPLRWIVTEESAENDESFATFRAAYISTGAVSIESDWEKARPTWNMYSPSDHGKATTHVVTCNPAFMKSPRNYLKDREFERPPRPEPKSKFESILERA